MAHVVSNRVAGQASLRGLPKVGCGPNEGRAARKRRPVSALGMLQYRMPVRPPYDGAEAHERAGDFRGARTEFLIIRLV
jgi:hypothetical protein